MTARCKAGVDRCWSTSLDGAGEKHAGVVAAEGRLCDKCARHAERVVDGLLDDWDALEVLLGVSARSEGQRVAYTPTPGIPLNVEAEARQVELLELADIAAEMITGAVKEWCDRDGHPIPAADAYRPPRQQRAHLAAAVDIIADNFATLLAVPAEPVLRWDRSGERRGEEPAEYRKAGPRTYIGLDADGNELDGRGGRWLELSGVDVALEIWQVHGKVRGMFGARQRDMRRRMPMPCHGCGNRTLYREYGQELIKCTTCPPNSDAGRGWTEEQYNRLAGLSRFHMQVVKEDEVKELAEAVRRAEDAEARAAEALARVAEAEEKLAKVAAFAGHTSVSALMDVIEKADADAAEAQS